jgi:hypothetical protein
MDSVESKWMQKQPKGRQRILFMPRKVPEGGVRLSPERKAPDKWDKAARRVIQREISEAEIDVEELAQRLKKLGYTPPTTKALALRLSRGTFSFGFGLMVLLALELDKLDLARAKKYVGD